ncbi:hypothetical protein SISNIDRAFT_483843 [Sistotremastrum niveocremeum HHB9708]|uniref:Uncharacterized protein n=1 Tax=Sistotremastrum niveocremeum HHB9708 TaxID=1314777 RepID=A0A164X468_9AGAM|nr:hypothetical protein SISNIDRAFT_483843 [Sistotremastrum niveocremeum HHB9708]
MSTIHVHGPLKIESDGTILRWTLQHLIALGDGNGHDGHGTFESLGSPASAFSVGTYEIRISGNNATLTITDDNGKTGKFQGHGDHKGLSGNYEGKYTSTSF